MKGKKTKHHKENRREEFVKARLSESELACLEANSMATKRSLSMIVRQSLGTIITPIAQETVK